MTQPIREGDRVKLVHTTDEYTDLESGATGSVIDIGEVPDIQDGEHVTVNQYWVDWDDGGTLAMIEGEDEIKHIE